MSIKRTEERAEAVRLRREGKSYNEIRKILGIKSKGTISYWLKDIELSASSKRKLEVHTQRAHERGFFKFNSDRSARIKNENKEAIALGKNEIHALTNRELMLVCAALYWGEGTKAAKKSNEGLSFVNSDPSMVRIVLQFIRKFLKVSEEKIRAGIHLYDQTNDIEGRNYWASVTNLPPDRFWIVRQVSSASKGKRDPRLLPFGSVVIRVHDRRLFYYVMGMIEGLGLIE